jgi:hypothetical protein
MTIANFEESSRDSITARRNYLVGLWAGRQLGLSGELLQRYAQAVHEADFEEAGPDDVVRKISTDFARAELDSNPEVVMKALAASEASARGELLATD